MAFNSWREDVDLSPKAIQDSEQANALSGAQSSYQVRLSRSIRAMAAEGPQVPAV